MNADFDKFGIDRQRIGGHIADPRHVTGALGGQITRTDIGRRPRTGQGVEAVIVPARAEDDRVVAVHFIKSGTIGTEIITQCGHGRRHYDGHVAGFTLPTQQIQHQLLAGLGARHLTVTVQEGGGWRRLMHRHAVTSGRATTRNGFTGPNIASHPTSCADVDHIKNPCGIF